MTIALAWNENIANFFFCPFGKSLYFINDGTWRCHPKEMSLAQPRDTLKDPGGWCKWQFLSSYLELGWFCAVTVRASFLLQARELGIFVYSSQKRALRLVLRVTSQERTVPVSAPVSICRVGFRRATLRNHRGMALVDPKYKALYFSRRKTTLRLWPQSQLAKKENCTHKVIAKF